MKVTKQLLREWEACYDDDELKAVFGRKRGFTPLEIFELKIPIIDRLWVLLHKEIIPEDTLHELGCIFTERRIKDFEPARKELQKRAIAAKRAWVRGDLSLADLNCHNPAVASKHDNAWWFASILDAKGQAWALKQVRKVL